MENGKMIFAHYAGAPYKIDDISLPDKSKMHPISEIDFDLAVNLFK
jgi:hypothetical protein